MTRLSRKLIINISVIVLCCIFSASCNTQQSVTVCYKDSQSNFGRMSAMDDEGNIYYVCDDDIYFLNKSSKAKIVVEGDDVTWITVSDYIYCVEDDDTLVCYDIETGEELAEYEFDAEKIVVKAIGNKLLLFSVVKENTFFIRYKKYIVQYIENDFKIKEFSSGDDYDGRITNEFVSVNELDNVYLHYDDEDMASDQGKGFDDIYFLKGNEYFGLKNLSSDWYYLPFSYNNDMYMSKVYWIFGPDLKKDERFELPEDIHVADFFQCFQYDDLLYLVGEKNDNIKFFKLDLNERVFEELSSFENVNISIYIGHIDDTVYYADGNDDVYSFCLSSNQIDLVYKSTNDTDKHYEICNDKLFICEYEFFGENVELIDISK